MMFLSGLFPNTSLYKLKLILHRCEKCDRTQTSASPTEQALGICSGNFCDLFAGCHMNFCNFISNIRDESGFVPLAPMWDRGEKRRIRLDEQPLERKLADNSTLFLGVFIRHGSGDTDIKIEIQSFLCRF